LSPLGLGVRSLPDIRLGEVISVAARRRRWTLKQKLALVEAVTQPGASVAAVSDHHGMSRSLLFEWRRQAREGTMPGMVRTQAPAALVPVRVVEDGPPKQAPPSRTERPGTATATIEVVLTNGHTVKFCATIGPEVLGRLAAALDA